MSQYLVPKIVRVTILEGKSRTFKTWSHVVTQCYAQLTHRLSLNEGCDSLRLHSGLLSRVRGSQRRFSKANPERLAAMAEQLFWTVLVIWANNRRALWSDTAEARLRHRFMS